MDRTDVPTESAERGAPDEPARSAAGQRAAAVTAAASDPASADAAPAEPDRALRYDTLKEFLAENASLIFMVGSLTSLTTFVVNLDLGWLDTYLKAALLAAAGTVWFEFHAQWPDEMRLDRRGHVRPKGGVWRLVAFSYLMQITVVLIAAWAIVQAPEVLIPLLTIGVVVLLWDRLARERSFRVWLLLAMVAVAFLGSELALERLFPHKTTLLDLVTIDVAREVEPNQPGA